MKEKQIKSIVTCHSVYMLPISIVLILLYYPLANAGAGEGELGSGKVNTAVDDHFAQVGIQTMSEQARHQVERHLMNAILAEDWSKVVEMLSKTKDANLPVEYRIIKAHACLATNRNNESLCLFLGNSSELALLQWEEWTKTFANKYPKKAIVYYLRGDCDARMGQWAQALDDFSRGTALDPNHILTRNVCAVVFARLGQTDKAFEDLVVASEIAPHFSDAFANLGAYAVRVKDGGKGGIEDYDRAIASSPDFALALFGRGCLRIAANNFTAAQEDFDRCWTLSDECLKPFLLAALLKARIAIDDPNDSTLVAMDITKPGFAVSSKTLSKFTSGDFGFSGWALQNALKNARNDAEVRTITNAVNSGLRVRPDAGSAVVRDYSAVQNWALRKGTIDKTISNWDVSLKGSLTRSSLGRTTGGETGIGVGSQIERNWDNYSNKFKALAVSIGKADLHSSAGSPQGFKTSPPVARDPGDWPFEPLYGLAYPLDEMSKDTAVQPKQEVKEGVK